MKNEQYEQLKEEVVLLFNNKMGSEGINLKYVKSEVRCNIQYYKLIIQNRFMDNRYDTSISLSKEGEKEIRDFFENKGVKFTFTNTVISIS